MAHKVVYNSCFGGFHLSNRAIAWLKDKGVATIEGIERHHPLLVECVETLGLGASGDCSKLQVASINGNLYRIDEYDGCESVIEPQDETWVTIEQ